MDFPAFVETFLPAWRDAALYGDEPTPADEFDLPEIVEVEPIHFCNFNCIMCHVHFEPALSRRRLDLDQVLNRLAQAGMDDRWLLISSGYEGTAHPDFSRFVNGVSELGMKIELTTNGSLLTKNLVNDIADCNFRYVTISFDGSRKETFEYIREGANFERTVERIENFCAALKPNNTYFNVNHTTMRRNLDEIPDTVKFWDARDIDQIFFIGMRVRSINGKHRDESLEGCIGNVVSQIETAAKWVIEEDRRITLASPFVLKSTLAERYPENVFHHVVHSGHPNARAGLNPRAYYQNGNYPGVPVACRSPFKFARIDYNGDVFLCQKFKIGNIGETSLTDIWYGEQAQRVRRLIRETPGPCIDCEHYQLCVKADELDVELAEALRQSVPRQLGEFMNYSILQHGDNYYGVPLSVIYEDLSPIAGATFFGRDVDEVTSAITQQAFGKASAD